MSKSKWVRGDQMRWVTDTLRDSRLLGAEEGGSQKKHWYALMVRRLWRHCYFCYIIIQVAAVTTSMTIWSFLKGNLSSM